MIISVLTALAEPTRLEAMRIMSDENEYCVCELMVRLNVTQSRMSRHMKVLAQAGLIRGRRDAQRVRYGIDPALDPSLRAVLDAALAARHETEREIA